MELAEMFPDEQSAVDWFETAVWQGERRCGHCDGTDTYRIESGNPMPYLCRDCKRYFSIKTGTVMAGSPLPVRKWVYAIYLDVTSLKGVSSMKLHRDIGVTQKTAWFMQQRIREAFAALSPEGDMAGPVEVDETYVGGKRKNMSSARRKQFEGMGRGPAGKTAVVGMKDRETNQVVARVIDRTDKETLQGFVDAHADPDAPLYTDDSSSYRGTTRKHETVKHSAAEYVRYLEGAVIHTNGIESLWSMLKRAHKGVYHRLSPKHLQAYVNMFAGRQNIRELDTLAQIQHVVAGLVGKRLMYRDLIADNGETSVAS